MSETLEQSGTPEDYREVQFGPKTLVVPNDWSTERFGDIFDRRRESIDDLEDETIKYIGLKHLDSGQLTINGFDEDGRERSSSRVFREGDVLFGKLRPNLNKAAVAPFSGVCSSDIIPIYAEKDAHQQCLPYLIHSKLVRDRVVSTMEGTNLPRTSWDDLKKSLIPLPSLPEQRRIADILSTVDEQIQQTDEMIEKRGELLTGLKQDLLLGRETTDKQEIQMGPKSVHIPSSWNVAKLGDVGRDSEKSFVDGDWVESDDMVEDGEYQLIQLGNIGVGEFKGECDKFVCEEFFQENNCTIVEQGDLLISRLADPVLRTIEVPKFEKKSITVVDIVIAKIDESSWDKRYLRFLLNSKVMSDVGGALATGSTRQRISRKNMESITIPAPPRATQSKIADVLEATKKEIQTDKKYKQNLQEIKRGLMQDLLTGKVRVNTD